MDIREIAFELSEVNYGSDDRPRSPGTHLSDVIRYIDNTAINKGKRPKYEDLSPSERKRMGHYTTGGFAWERVLERSLEDAFASGGCVRPGEVILDGIACNPDMMDMREGVLEEWKSTWRSSRRTENLEIEFWSWFVQMKAYCKVLGLLRARLRVFFVNGDYRDSGPLIKCWEMVFSQEELDENWKMILNNSRMVR